MKNYFLLLTILLTLFAFSSNAQVEKVIVETYYVSDSLDATDTTGGVVEIGSKTYRIFIDLKPGTILKKIYGDALHPLKISSTKSFYNHTTDGQSFGKDFSKNRLGESTVALDTWLTLGQTTKTSTNNTYFGIPKIYDTDGSMIGGVNNDGGSEMLANGLLTNKNKEAGIAVTSSDGLMKMTSTPDSWGDYGIRDFTSNIDSSIFGSIIKGTTFISYNAGLQNSGTIGVVVDSNQVLVAQLTTKGELTFELNIEVEETNGVVKKIVKYVANADTLLADEVSCPFLKYPLICGCKDPNYVEYSAEFGCNNPIDCKTPVVYGCLDTSACNYNPKANYNLKSMCCYPGYCNDRDLSSVCPSLKTGNFEFFLYPNPAQEFINLNFNSSEEVDVKFSIFNAFGTEIINEEKIGNVSGEFTTSININDLLTGVYIFRLNIDGNYLKKSFSKN